MNKILAAASTLQNFLSEKGWEFCFIGGVAVLRWGRPRMTQDVDVSLFCEFGNEREIIGEILDRFSARVQDPAAFAEQSRVVLVESDDGVAYDIVLAQFKFEKEIIDRATFFEYPDNVRLKTASAEDLIVMKCFAGRDRDWNDVEGLVTINRNADFDLVFRKLESLSELKPDSDPLKRLKLILNDLN